MKISLISAALPPRTDGIGDYTALLARELAIRHSVTIFTGQEGAAPIDDVRIDNCFIPTSSSTYWSLVDRIEEERPDWVVLQYNPFCYGRRGKNLDLPRVMSAVKKRCIGTRFALMVHEPFMPFENLKASVMTTWQRYQLWSLGNTADATFYSIQMWAKRFQRWFPDKQAVHLPVGANIPYTGAEREVVRESLGIPSSTFVLGFFGQAHNTRLTDCMHQAAVALEKQGKKVMVLCIGSGGEELRSSFGAVPVKITGRLAAEGVSYHLAAIDIYLAVFKDGVSCRRGSMMAGLQHGLPTVGTSGPYTDGLLMDEDGRSFVLCPVGDQRKFNDAIVSLSNDHDRRVSLGLGARRLFNERFSWDRIAARMMEELQATSVSAGSGEKV